MAIPVFVAYETVNGEARLEAHPALKQTDAEIAAGVTPVNYAYASYTSNRVGATMDGGTDDLLPLQNLLSSAGQSMGGRACRVIRLEPPNGATDSFKCSAGLVLNPLKSILDGQGCTLDFSAKTSGAFVGLSLDVAGFTTNISNVAARMAARGIRNIVIEMPGYTVNSLGVGLRLTDSVGDGGGNYYGPRHKIDGVTIYGGNVGVHFSTGSYCDCITGLTVMHGASNTLNIAIYADSTWPTSDGGESPALYGTFIASAQTAVWLTGGSMRFHGGNIDGCKTIFKQDDIGTLAAYGAYMEFVDGDDTQFKFDASTVNARIELIGCEFGTRQDVGVRATKAFANVSGKLSMRDCTFRGNAFQWYTANSGFLCTGSGTVEASGIKWLDSPWYPLVAKSLQWLAYPDINNANALASFTLSKVGLGVNPVRAAAVSDGSTSRDAIDFKISSGGVSNDESAAVFTHAVIPGRTVSIVGGFYCPSITAGNVTLEIILFSFKDSAGNVILGPFSQVLTVSTTVATWSTFTGLTAGVPQGAETMTVEIRLRASGAIAADRHCYISPLGIGYVEGS